MAPRARRTWSADGKTFSERIWEQQNSLTNTLSTGLARTLIRGEAPDDLLQMFQTMDHYCDADGNFDLEAAKEAYKNFLTTVPEDNRIILRDFMDWVSYAEKEEKGLTFGYSISDDTLYYNPKEPSFYRYSFEVACTHELSHRIDYCIVKSWKDADYCKAVKAYHQNIVGRSKELIEYCDNNDKDGFISDILSALCEGDVRFTMGHEQKYWTKNAKRAPMEVFANLYSLETMQDAEKLIFVEKNFPDIWSAFQRMHP